MAAQARLRGAAAAPNPTLNVAGHVGNADVGGTDEDYILAHTVELGDKRRQRVRGARAELAAAREEQADTTGRELTYTVHTAYFQALRAQEERRLAADSLAFAQAILKTAQIQFEAGDVPRSNVVRSQVEVSRAEQALAAADADLQNQYSTVRSLTGIPESTPLQLTDTLSYAPVPVQVSSLEARALRQRQDLAAAESTSAAREAAVHAAKVASQPDLVVEGRHSYIDPTVGSNSVRAGFTFPILDMGRNRADVRAAEASLHEQEGVVAETRRTILLDVDTAARNLQQSETAVESFRSGRLERSRELLDMARTGYEQGANSLLELLDAETVYRNEQAEYARALAAYNTNLAALEHAVGGPVR